MVKISEKILIYKIRTKKDAEAFALLYDEYIEKIYRFIFFKISHKQEAEDLTSEVFLKTWNYLTEDQAAPVRTFGGLIYSIARNSVIDWYRKRAKASEYELAEEIADVAGVDMAEKININQETEQLLKLVKTLKQDYQEIILLKFIEGLSVSEIARILGKKNIAVRVTIHRAIKKLKELNGK
jgi:RNA polymerase sigma-70 factor (ECF subfamily)